MNHPWQGRISRLAALGAALVVIASAVATPSDASQNSPTQPYISASVPVADGCIVLGRAWSGDKVFMVQRRLGTTYEKDRYQWATVDAVQQFQRNHQLKATGRVNRGTWRAFGFNRPFCMDRFTVQPQVGLHADAHRRIETMIAWAKQQVGRRYIWGGAGPIGYDCSGLSLQAMYSGGRVIPSVTTKLHQRQDFPTASRIYTSGLRRVPLAERRRGDLVFYGPSGSISHMAIYLGHDRVLEAVRPRIRVSSMWGHGVPLKPKVARPFGR